MCRNQLPDYEKAESGQDGNHLPVRALSDHVTGAEEYGEESKRERPSLRRAPHQRRGGGDHGENQKDFKWPHWMPVEKIR